ncbi:DUF5106 domain-containing protein [Parabacteroides sp. AF48-14]|uniref:DUF5106 domain-containing protein n=1 Tax=Parabacteroides sp. AF48-14 TaxID=2292052 RepID=UPI000EFDBCA1|nr:DUF5106 domain-containing protein [Parabacteroides sp. AF48-14]RHO67081.1 DUF5106 domain-containing protein [Parabacteroides sp. AF48-14]
MKGKRNILTRYKWDVIGVWSALLVGCFGVLLFTGSLVLLGCRRLAVRQPEEPQAVVTKPVKPFTLPAIPITLTDPATRADYLVAHYWDSLDFADTTRLTDEQIEQAFADYLDVLAYASPDAANTSIGRTLDKARPVQAAFGWFTEMYEKYLYDPNSPMQNEERYRVVLEHIIADQQIEDIYKVRPAFQLEQENKNRPGNVASDFTYTLANGKKGTLHGIKADYTLLFFYDPECPDCRHTREFLQQSEQVTNLVNSGKLKILALYPDEDIETWKAYRSAIPPTWLNACDGTAAKKIKSKLYAIRAIPSLYLLDKNKRVLLRDAVIEQIIPVLTAGI